MLALLAGFLVTLGAVVAPVLFATLDDRGLAGEIAGGTMIPLVLKDFSPSFSVSLLGIVSLAGRTPSPAAKYTMDRLAKLAQARPAH